MSNIQTFPAANPIPALPLASTGASGTGTEPAPGELPALERIWLALNKYRIDIAVIMVLALVGALLLTLLATPKYTATSRIEISRQQERVTKAEGLTPDSAGQDLEFYQTQYSLLESRSLAQRVVRAKRLTSDRAFLEAYELNEAAVGDGAKKGGSAREALEDAIVDILVRDISINPVRNSALVDVSYTSPNPEVSRDIASAWVSQFIETTLARRFDSTADARAYLTKRLDEYLKKLEDSERALVAYAAQKNILPLETTVDAEGRTTGTTTDASQTLQDLNAALAKATVDRIEAQSKLSNGGAQVSSENALGSVLPGLRQRRAEVAAEYAKMGAQFEDGYPPMKALKSQLASLDGAIAREQGRVSTGTRQDYQQALARENELKARVAALQGRMFGQRSDMIQYNIIQREVDTNRQQYDGLLQRYKEIGVAGVGASNISVVDNAEKPVAPSSPNLKLNLALAVVVGIGLALAYVSIRDQVDQSVSNPSDVTGLLGLSLLGPVPRMKDEDVSEAMGDRKSELWEAYSAIATNLSFLTDHGIPRSMMFTSTVANEGKSTSVYSLAEVMAILGKRVIILDADLRNPTAHTFFGLSNDRGLSNYLAGSELAIREQVPTASGAVVDVVPAGPTPPSTVELLTSDRLAQVVRDLSTRYDHVLIDAPPVLGLADAPLLSRIVEGVVMTIEANHMRIRRIKGAIERIRAAHSHIFGAILTKVDQRNSAYGYGYGYGYGNGQFEYGGSKKDSAS